MASLVAFEILKFMGCTMIRSLRINTGLKLQASSRRVNEVKTNLREVGVIIEEGTQDSVTRVRTVVIRKPTDIGKMPLEQFESFDKRSKCKSPNDMNDVPQNTTTNDISGDTANHITNPKLAPYVFRLGSSDKFACKYCKITDDKWGMKQHYHAEGYKLANIIYLSVGILYNTPAVSDIIND